MYEDLHDKTAVVTGSSKGLGASIAQRLGAEGMNIVVNYHTDEEGARATIRAIEDAGGAGTAIQADVSSEAGIQALRDHALSSFGGIDVWVNNAGVESEMPSDERTVEEWQRVIDVNLTGVFMAPGAMAFTRMPRSAYSSASVLVSMPTPALLAA